MFYSYYGVVALIPIFQYSNVYAATPKLKSLAEDKELQNKCITYVSKSGMYSFCFQYLHICKYRVFKKLYQFWRQIPHSK